MFLVGGRVGNKIDGRDPCQGSHRDLVLFETVFEPLGPQWLRNFLLKYNLHPMYYSTHRQIFRPEAVPSGTGQTQAGAGLCLAWESANPYSDDIAPNTWSSCFQRAPQLRAEFCKGAGAP